MTEDRKEIIDAVLEKFKYDRNFETDDFIYWINEYYTYNGDSSYTREEFTCIKDYVIKHGKLPSQEILYRDNPDGYYRNLNTGTSSNQTILRYSKKYNNVELYSYATELRASTRSKSKRVLVIPKRISIFSINDKDYVLIGGNRWLSLKNMQGFYRNNQSYLSERSIKLLMSKMIGGKDWVMDLEIENCGFMIKNKSARKANSFEDAINIECGATPAKAIRKVIVDVNNVINLYSILEPNKIHFITNFIKSNLDRLKELLKNNYGAETGDLILYYYFLTKDNRCEESVLRDYFRMLRDSGKKINLNMTSYATIKSKHDELSRDIFMKKSKKGGNLRVAKIYPKIESTPEVEVELIKTVGRLNKESAILHHCVHSYKDEINKGNCAIYSLFFDGNPYTLQVNAESRKKISEDEEEQYDFRLVQLKGKHNVNAPESIKKNLEIMCEKNELLPLYLSGIRFDREGDKENVKVKVEQIGDAILDELINKRGRFVEEYPF